MTAVVPAPNAPISLIAILVKVDRLVYIHHIVPLASEGCAPDTNPCQDCEFGSGGNFTMTLTTSAREIARSLDGLSPPWLPVYDMRA